jgi:CRISPR-associated protein Cmr2
MPNPTVTARSTEQIYTAITFAPVQGFIEKSRKLRDLYGSSYILSFLAKALCEAVPEEFLISPANINITRGTPNVIIVKNHFPTEEAKKIFDEAWCKILDTCRNWIEQNLVYEWKWNETQKTYEPLTTEWNYTWKREWKLWSSHAWEFFWAQGSTVETAKKSLFAKKHSRAWTAINWTGESSTLSGADALAIPSAGTFHPKQGSYKDHDAESKAFFAQLSAAIGEAFISYIEEKLKGSPAEQKQLIDRYGIELIEFVRTKLSKPHNETLRQIKAKEYGESILDPTEQLSIPELAKRLITLEVIAEPLGIEIEEIPKTYRDLNRIPKQSDERRWTGWFLGDGDKASAYLKGKSDDDIKTFSRQMLHWGEHQLKPSLNDTDKGRIIYAGGDDFLGVFYHLPDDSILQPQECLNWFYKFKSDRPDALWSAQTPITVSVGFVWAAPNVPQREVLQHCREAQDSAKDKGRDRLALRILFNDGKHLEWVCPWRFLSTLENYRDRKNGNNWTHIFDDVAVLESRHAFQGKDNEGRSINNQLEVALALLNVYFNTTDNFILSSLIETIPYSLDGEPDWESFFRRDDCWNIYNGSNHYEPNGARPHTAGILGDRATCTEDRTHNGAVNILEAKQALTDWIINLAKIGFHLCSEIENSKI